MLHNILLQTPDLETIKATPNLCRLETERVPMEHRFLIVTALISVDCLFGTDRGSRLFGLKKWVLTLPDVHVQVRLHVVAHRNHGAASLWQVRLPSSFGALGSSYLDFLVFIYIFLSLQSNLFQKYWIFLYVRSCQFYYIFFFFYLSLRL